MGDQVERIERHIQQQRTELRDNMLDLTHKATSAVDWRSQCDARPMTMVGIAFGGGVLLSLLIGGRRGPRSHTVEAMAGMPLRDDGAVRPWELFKGALLGVVATKLGSALESVLPGFQEEYKRVEAAKL